MTELKIKVQVRNPFQPTFGKKWLEMGNKL